MREAFLHFIWQYQYFDKKGLKEKGGSDINIKAPGSFNTNAGPDFSQAIINIDDIEWRGHVELHTKSSDWQHHNHHKDKAYNNVILHVVWEDDKPCFREDGSELPVIELQGRIDEKLIFEYKKLLNSPWEVPCQNQLDKVTDLVWYSAFDKVLMQRLEEKSLYVRQLFELNNNDWEEAAYQLLSKNFGFKINSEPFLTLAQSLPYKIIKKNAGNITAIEALLIGQAGFLDEEEDDAYQQKLTEEYKYLAHKYELTKRLDHFQWKMMRLRPANFPLVRIAQLASIVNQLPSLFASLLEIDSVKRLNDLLNTKMSDYWSRHYRFGKVTKSKVPELGDSAMHNIAINTVVPLMVAYGKYMDDESFVERGVKILTDLKPEENKIIKYWRSIGVDINSAFDSQAAIQLYNHYCNKKKCLSCLIGASLVKPQ